jgi:hypothetical protein
MFNQWAKYSFYVDDAWEFFTIRDTDKEEVDLIGFRGERLLLAGWKDRRNGWVEEQGGSAKLHSGVDE